MPNFLKVLVGLLFKSIATNMRRSDILHFKFIISTFTLLHVSLRRVAIRGFYCSMRFKRKFGGGFLGYLA